MCSGLHDTKILPPSGWGREPSNPPQISCPQVQSVPQPQAASLLPMGVTQRGGTCCTGTAQLQRSHCMALAKHHCPSFPPGLCSCLWAFSRSCGALAPGASGWKHISSPGSPRRRWQRAAVLSQAALEQERCHVLSSPRGCWPCLPLQSQSRHLQAGADQDLMETWLLCADQGPAGCWAVLQQWGRLHDLLPTACGQGQQPCHTSKEHRTRSTTCKPSTLASSCDPREPISSL